MSVQASVAVAGTGGSSSAALDAAYPKVTWRLIPFLMALWVLAWIDRVNIGFVKLQMLSDLKCSETVYGLGAGIFFSATSSSRCPATCCCRRSARAQDDHAHHDRLGPDAASR